MPPVPVPATTMSSLPRNSEAVPAHRPLHTQSTRVLGAQQDKPLHTVGIHRAQCDDG